MKLLESGHEHVKVGVRGRRRGGRFRVRTVLSQGHRARPAGGGAEAARRAGPAAADRGRGAATSARAGGEGGGSDGALCRDNVEELQVGRPAAGRGVDDRDLARRGIGRVGGRDLSGQGRACAAVKTVDGT